MTFSNYSVMSSYVMSSDLLANVTLSPEDVSTSAGSHQRLSLMKQSVSMTALLSVAYGIVFILGVVNNSLVVSVIYQNRQMRTITNYFIANLAVADIVVSFIVLPFTLMNNIMSAVAMGKDNSYVHPIAKYKPSTYAYLYGDISIPRPFYILFVAATTMPDWLFGVFMCKAIGYLQTVAVGASVNTLAAVAVERYLAIYYPHLSIITAHRALVIIGVIWLIPAFIQIPWALYNDVFAYTLPPYGYIHACKPQMSRQLFRNFLLYGVFLTCYMIPLCFLAVFYTLIGIRVWKRNVAGIRGSQAERNIARSKRRIVRMLIAVTVFFTLSWLPLYVLHLRSQFGPALTGARTRQLVSIMEPIAQWLGSANSCMNPFIYCYFSKHFRRSILAVLRRGPCCGKVHLASYNEVTTHRTHL